MGRHQVFHKPQREARALARYRIFASHCGDALRKNKRLSPLLPTTELLGATLRAYCGVKTQRCKLPLTTMTRRNVCKNGHNYTASTTEIVERSGKQYQQCMICKDKALRQERAMRAARNGNELIDLAEVCRGARHHKRTKKNTYTSPQGKITCMDCAKRSARRRRRKAKMVWLPCMVARCKRRTERISTNTAPYICGEHKTNPPEAFRSFLAKLGKLELLLAA